jgi:RNA polymerase sigma-70 factor (ECF subfamily)
VIRPTANRTCPAVRTGAISALAESQPVPPGEPERRLLARLAAGEREDPLSALYALYGRQVYGLGLHLLRDAGLAEDLVQETFVRLWRSAPSYDPARGSVRTFVFTLARRAAVDLWRRRGVTTPAVLDEPERPDVAGTEAYEHLLLRLAVGEALLELSQSHREVLELQYHEDLTQAQVAERLGIPLGTVKTRTMYALRALGRILEEHDVHA